MYEELVKKLHREADRDEYENYVATMLIQAADAIEDLDNKLNLWRQGKIKQWTELNT